MLHFSLKCMLLSKTLMLVIFLNIVCLCYLFQKSTCKFPIAIFLAFRHLFCVFRGFDQQIISNISVISFYPPFLQMQLFIIITTHMPARASQGLVTWYFHLILWRKRAQWLFSCISKEAHLHLQHTCPPFLLNRT